MQTLIRSAAALAVGLIALATMAATGLAQSAFDDAQKAEIENIIKDYLAANPEVVRDALIELEKRQAAAQLAERAKAVAANEDRLLNSPRQVVLGNPDGDVTLVEFFDYNCGFCKRALSDMLELIEADPNLRIVLKEFPVLGRESLEVAQVAIAVAQQDADYMNFHRQLLTKRGRADKARAMEVAKSMGLDMDKLEADMKAENVAETISEVYELANALGIGGTPAYVVGNEVIDGAVGFPTLHEKIAAVRKCGATVC